MKLVCVADAHLHPFRVCSTDGGHDRLLDGLSVLRQSLALARDLGAVWVMAGDFKQPKTSWPQEALTGAHALLREYSDVAKVMVAGNHDAEGIGGSGLAPFKDVATVVESPQIVTPREDLELVCAPWNADRKTVRTLINARAVHQRSVLVAHGYLQGCMLGPESTRLSDKGIPLEEYGDFKVAIFGDIHKGQWRRPGDAKKRTPAAWLAYDKAQVRAGGEWKGEVYYCGSPYQQNWGERNDPAKGALVVDLATGYIALKELKAPKFVHLELDEKGLNRFVSEANGEGDPVRGNFIRVVYTGKPCAALDDLRDLAETCRSFQLILRREERQAEQRAQIHAGMDMGDILQGYVTAHPPPEGVDPARALEALKRLTS